MNTKDRLTIKPETMEAVGSAPDMSHPTGSAAAVTAASAERRGSPDRRKRTLHSLFYGSFYPRRRNARRTDARSLRDVDWHSPQWLAVAMLIVILSSVDAALTLSLLEHGAYELNPFMAPIVGGSSLVFTVVKVGLTAGGVILLTLAARMRAFGRIPVGFLLYGVLLTYSCLIVYELRLLEETLLTF